MTSKGKLGLIAGNGKFPFLIVEAARARGLEVVVAAIKEETFPDIESSGAASVHWLSLCALSKLIETFKREDVHRAIMAGQVKHKQIFSSIKPDWRLAKLLLSLRTRNTDALLGAVAKVLGDEGITLENSTSLLEPLLAKAGVLTDRTPTTASTDGAGNIMRSLGGDASTLSRSLTVVKIAKPNQDMRFDVPVIGVKTIEVMRKAGASCLAIDAGKCLLLDGEAVITAANDGEVAIVAD